MKNKEKYAKEILEVACEGYKIAFNKKTNELVSCACTDCADCLFKIGSCNENIRKWCESEYIEPPVDWIKVPVDTPILVRDEDEEKFRKRHFAKYENGKVYAWNTGVTSWTADDEYFTPWDCAKLAEPNNT